MQNSSHGDRPGDGLAASRRDVLKAMGAGAAVTAAAQSGGAAPSDIIMKTAGKTGQSVPAIGLGSYLTFDTIPGQKRDHLFEVFKVFWEGGGRVVDTSPLYGTGEITVGDAMSRLGVNDEVFVANKIWSTGDFLFDDSHAERSFQESQRRLWRESLDVMQVHSLTNVAVILPILKAWKKEGRIKYVGVTHHEPPYFDLLADSIAKGKPDFVQVHYSISNRLAEQKILPAAADAGAAVLINMPLEKARLPKLVENQPLPDFAKEIGAENWAQFFLKWVISHPAVTCAIPATANPEHAKQNIGALRGPLPDQKMRERMVKHMETIPGFAELDKAPRYPGKKYPGIIARAQGELKARG
ncbi:MAG: aldo/keto reductase [Hyphomicrobiales bacterium]